MTQDAISPNGPYIRVLGEMNCRFILNVKETDRVHLFSRFDEAIKKGELSATVSTSPGVEGLTCFEALFRHVGGQKVPKQVMIPMLWIDKTNVDQAVAWKVDDNAYEIVKKLFDSFK